MCGIAGFMSPRGTPAEPIARMTALVRHRGPDDEGYVLFDKSDGPPMVCGGKDTPDAVYKSALAYAPASPFDANAEEAVSLALGHRRLSIVDLSPLGHQPMCSDDGRYWLVHNGEIYNYIELREELTRLGHRFRSQSDTEVIIAAYAEWGEDCLKRFNGMWAFALYDAWLKTLFLARDRFGIKPLYYWISPCGTVCFASEIKSFTAFPGWSARLNPATAYDFLAWGMSDHTDETLFARVYQLAPGHFTRLHKGEIRRSADGRLPVTRWYELGAATFEGSLEDAAGVFRERFTDAVRLHLRADVPVGSCLSGGLDSSSIVCMMNRLLREQNAGSLQKSFSSCAVEKRFDERAWIEEVVQATGIQPHYVYPTFEKLFAESEAITWHQDEPFGSTSIYAQWNVFRLAAEQGVTVMLDGQGADELLAGYHGFFGPRFAALLRAGQWLLLWSEIRKTKRVHGYSELRAAMHIANILLPEMIKQPLRAYTGRDSAKPVWLNVDALGVEPCDPHVRLGANLESIQGMSRAQLTTTNLQRLLHWEDRDSMAHSVESRVPFLDYRLVEFVFGLPDGYKLSEGITKRVLRLGMSGVLPDKIRDRVDKKGFETPEEIWLRERAPDAFRKKMRQAVDTSRGLLEASSLEMLEQIIAGRKPFSFTPWRLINFAEWLEVFSVRAR